MTAPRYRLAIFDFDGTLADSFPWFAGVVNSVAERYRFKRIAPEDEDVLRRMSASEVIGHLGVSWWKLPLIARHMRNRVASEIDRIALFAGVEEMLHRLSERGVALAIVSSNSEANVRRVLGPRNTALIRAFGCGAAVFGKRRKFRRILRHTGHRPAETICVGDEIRDFEAATGENLSFGAVTWGYTAPDALAALNPREVFHDVEDILEKIG